MLFLLIYFFTLGILTLSPSSPTLRGHLPQSHASPSRFVSYKNFVWTPLLPRSAQLIRALALRVLASLRVPDIVQIQLFELRRMIKDVCVGARFFKGGMARFPFLRQTFCVVMVK